MHVNKKEEIQSLSLPQRLLEYFILLVCTASLFFVIFQFNIEQDTRLNFILPVIGFGFGIHYWLQKKWRLPFFILISILSIVVVLGLVNSIFLTATGAFLIVVCHLPIRYNWRLLLIGAITVGLILLRLNVLKWNSMDFISTFIGSMFMLRLFIYLYELKYDDNYKNTWHRIAYFFLIPNICFPLFPLVDFKTSIKTYYNDTDRKVYSVAIRRIFRGIIHLLAYRIIYYYLVPDATEIEGVYDIIQFLVFSYALILRLSGMFHLSLGILGLFGFNLPDIFDNYFFASSFNDIWRRINTYWRDALMKIVYYPIYFKIKKAAKSWAIPITILIVFFINWLLHSYQMLWIKGDIPLAANDMLFWAVFGIAVMLNSLYLEKTKRSQKIKPNAKESLKTSLLHILKVMGMLVFMSLIWGMWTATSITEWIYLLSFLLKGSMYQWLTILAGFVVLFVLFFYFHYSYQKGVLKKIVAAYTKNINAITVACIAVLFILSFSQISSHFTWNGQPVIELLKENRLSTKDKKMMERGYYQTLLNNDNTSIQLWEKQLNQPREWFDKNEALLNSKNPPYQKLRPNYSVIFKGELLSTNRWGMRDKDYDLEKPDNVFRLALLGGSYEMGSGVGDGENYESLLENKLNEGDIKCEVLNFAVGGYHLIENEYNAEHSLLNFKPDAIIYSAHSDELYRIVDKLTLLIMRDANLENPFLIELVKKSGARSGMCSLEIQNRIKPYADQIIAWGYKSIVDVCKRNNIAPIWIYVPTLGDRTENMDCSEIQKIAQKAGFITIPLNGIYDTYSIDELIIAPWDTHPNKKGHQLIANKLYTGLILKAAEIGLKK